MFGNLTMSFKSELNQVFENNGEECVKCICEVPPLPTCRKIPKEQCDNSKQQTS